MSIVALPAQLQNFSLSGSGSSIGDTVLNLKSFKDILGVNLTMSSFGSIGYGTLEPGNGVQEEQISFTGITQNADGTAQLTGVKHVLFISPYTETSGMTITHPGSVTFVISNTSGFENAVYTFITNTATSGGVPARLGVQGITALSLDPVVLGTPIAVGTNDPRIPSTTVVNYVTSVVNTGIPFAIGAGTSTAYTATLASSISILASGTMLDFIVPATNATGVTLNINSLGAKPIKKNFNATLSSGDISLGQIAQVAYDGSNFQLLSPVSQYLTAVSSGAIGKDISLTTSTVVAHGLGIIPKLVRMTSYYNNNPFSGSSVSMAMSSTAFSSSTQSSTYSVITTGDGATGSTANSGNTFRIGGNTSAYEEGSISVDATNITITWSKTGSPTGSAFIIWDATA